MIKWYKPSEKSPEKGKMIATYRSDAIGDKKVIVVKMKYNSLIKVHNEIYTVRGSGYVFNYWAYAIDFDFPRGK